jgi:hypothetical protein
VIHLDGTISCLPSEITGYAHTVPVIIFLSLWGGNGFNQMARMHPYACNKPIAVPFLRLYRDAAYALRTFAWSVSHPPMLILVSILLGFLARGLPFSIGGTVEHDVTRISEARCQIPLLSVGHYSNRYALLASMGALSMHHRSDISHRTTLHFSEWHVSAIPKYDVAVRPSLSSGSTSNCGGVHIAVTPLSPTP